MFRFFLFLMGVVVAASVSAQSDRPNIILILADDMGCGDVSALNINSKIKTPYIDQLIREGISFSDAHTASSVCTPSRYALLTGRYAWRSTLKSSVLNPFDPPLIEKEQLTIGDMLNRQGYATACIGKWHLGWDWPLQNGSFFKDSLYAGHSSESDRIKLSSQIDFSLPIQNGPTTRGFRYYFGVDVPNFPPYTFIRNDKVLKIPDTKKPDKMYGHKGAMAAGWKLEDILPTLGDKALEYIEEKAKLKTPFFLYMPLTSPHTPVAPTDAFKNTSQAGLYGDFVQQTDYIVGRVMKAIESAGIKENTLIIFTSDNGSPENDGEGMAGAKMSVKKYNHDPSAGKRGIKADLYEGGHKVPFIARWPAVIKKNTTNNNIVCLVDLMATAADITGARVTEKDAVDSYSLLPIFKGIPAGYQRSSVVHHSIHGYFGIRKGKWKLLMSPGSGGWTFPRPGKDENGLPPIQLFDLNTDPQETNNVYKAHPLVVAALTKLLTAYITNGRSTKGSKQDYEKNFKPATMQGKRI